MNKFNFITKKLPDAALLESILSDSVFSLLINSSNDIDKIDLQQFHKKEIYLNPLCTFSLYLNFQNNHSSNQQFIEGLITRKDLLVQLLFHPHFEKSGNKPVLFLNEISKNNFKIDAFIDTLHNFLCSQGFEGIDIIYLNQDFKKINYSGHYLYTFKSNDDLRENYYQLLVKKVYIARYLAILDSPTDGAFEILNSQLQTEKQMMENFPEFYHLAKLHFISSKKIPILEEELKHLRSDLNNQKEYLQFFRNQDEAIKINQFYHNEYEILPLWYKKLGHIIKVLMGKRTFHSLFDNNVKKYKN